MVDRRCRLLLWLGSLVLGSALSVGPAQAATFVVNDNRDNGAANPNNNGVCDAQGPQNCTLRAAMEEALNTPGGPHTIQFNLASTITIGSNLPQMAQRMIIDAATGNPFWVNSPPYAPVVAVNGNGRVCFDIIPPGSQSVIRGLAIYGCGWPGAIAIQGSSNNVIAGNFLGTDLTGTAAGPGGQPNGIYLGNNASATNGNRIGVNPAAVDVRDRNVISGNSLDGIEITGGPGGAANTVIAGNYIGTDVTGTLDLGNTNQGIAIFGAAPATNTNTVVGGTAAGTGNVISGNGGFGVMLADAGTSGTLVQGNKIGTNATGTAGIPNGVGVRLDSTSISNNTIGGTTAAASNIIAYNLDDGVRLTASAGTGNRILGNAIYANSGLGIDLNDDGVTANDADDTDGGPNNRQNFPVLSAATTDGLGTFANVAGSLDGAASTTYRIEFFASSAADPSGFGEGERYLGFTNVTTDGSGNGIIGATLATSLAAGEYVTATATDPSNSTSEFSSAVQAVASLVVTTTADTADGNTASVAALIASPGADGRFSLREVITATNATAGTDTIRFGIPLTDANHFYYRDDAIAGLTNIQATTLADQPSNSSPVITDYDLDYPTGRQRSWYRIQLLSALPTITGPVLLDTTSQPLAYPARGPIVELVGTALVNTLDLQPGSSGSTIRGFIINNSGDNGIFLGSSNNVVTWNYLGTNASGTALGPGNRVGLRIGISLTPADNNRVGGTTAADRNVISGNTVDGLMITGGAGGAANNLIQGNYVGLDVTGTLDVGNTNQGIAIWGGNPNTNNVIGGTAPGAGNVISGNDGHGVAISDAGTTGTLVQGNWIGTNAAGTAGIPNGGVGVRFAASTSNNRVGGTTGNIIAYNGDDGIALTATVGSGNAIVSNQIHSNGGLGIDLKADGVTLNDSGDGDTGPNDLMNYPLFSPPVETVPGTLTVTFGLDTAPGYYRVEFFKNPFGGDASGYGEGRTPWSSVVVNHLGGLAGYSHSFSGNTGDLISATATSCTDGAACTTWGSTSEFSKVWAAVTTAVTLLSFSATGGDREVDLSWATASELQNLGFHLYRAGAEAGPYARITPSLIPGLGSSATGRSYSYRDDGLVNGRKYFYKLEDVESTGRTTLHGPVSATPATPAPDTTPSPPPTGSPGTAYGDPRSVVLREIERSTRHVTLELLTGGFFAEPTADGRVRLSVPGFESASEPGEPSLPMRRALVEATAGRKIVLASVTAEDVVTFSGLRPTSEAVRAIEVDWTGSVAAGEGARAEGAAFRRLFPSEAARLVRAAFQGERKTAEVLLFPLRWDGKRLVLSRRLRVRLEFAGRDEAESSRGGARGRRPRVRSSHASGGVVAQLVVKEPGLYRVAYEELWPASNRPPRVDVSRLRLSRQGSSVAFHVEPDNRIFGPGSALFFLSEGASLNPYGDAAYELETNTPGRLMDVEGLPAKTGTVNEYQATVEKEENRYYQSGLLEAPDLWLWDLVVSPGSKSYAFSLDRVSLGGTGRVSVVLQGASDVEGVIDHHVRVGVNGTLVGEDTWDGKVARTLEAELPAGLLREGQNTLEIEDVGDTGAPYSMVFLNRFRVAYARKLVATAGTLEGRFQSAGQAAVEDVAGPTVALLDTTESPRWLKGAHVGPASLSFPVAAGRSYRVTSAFLRPQVRLLAPSTLKSTTTQADYLVLAPRAFLPAAEPLLARRESEGLRTKAVPVEEIYEQFGHGEAGPQAIKEFLEYAYQSWAAPSVRYVLLLGDASYDPKNYLGTGVANWLPGYPVKTSYLWTVSDPGYASVNGEDEVPDVAIGRLPASTVAEAERLVGKVLAFEDGGGDFQGRAVLVADNADQAGSFEADADDVASTVFAGRSVQKIYYSRERANTRAEIVAAFDAGPSFLSYAGHGGTALWASENIFNNWDVAALRAQSRQPFLATMNCLNGFFHFPPLNALSEALLKADGKGAIAAFSPSGLSLNQPAHLYHKALLKEILSGRHARLGDAILAAQEDYASSGAMPELLSIYHLFGDPALRIR